MSTNDFFFVFRKREEEKKELNHSLIDLRFDDFMDHLPFIRILYIDRTSNIFSRAVRGENFLYVSKGGALISTSIPMSGLSNRCN